MSFLFGGSKEKSTSSSSSSNRAYDTLLGSTQPTMASGSGATSILNKMLGISAPQGYTPPSNALDFLGRSMSGNINGIPRWASYNEPMGSDFPYMYGGTPPYAPPGVGGNTSQGNPFESWLDQSGYSFVRDQGTKAVESSYGGRGVANSGAAAKALTKFGQGTANTYLQQYLDNLMKQQQAGLSSQALLSGAGGVSNSTGNSSGSSNKGAGDAIGTALSLIALSDPKVKTNIEKVGQLDNGLGVYEFEYLFDPGKRWIGVMADEVSLFQPDALGPKISGYQTVDYAKIEGWND